MGGRKTINNTTPAIGAIAIQQSTYGLVLPVVWGRTRITGNLIWYGDFKSTAHTEVTQRGGKGGGAPDQTTTTYTYSASVLMALCEGPIMEVRTCWRGKSIFGGTTYSGARQLATLNTMVDGGTVTVGGAGWADVSVEVEAANDFQDDYRYVRSGSWTPLVRGVDYTAANGVYTFSGLSIGQRMRIVWSFVSAASGSSVLNALHMDLRDGSPGQAPYSYLVTKHPSEALGYSGIAYLAAPNYELNSAASVENHSFEVTASLSYSDTIPDANPGDIVVDAMANPHYGAGFGREKIASVADYLAACAAQGIFLSPALTEQSSAAAFLESLAALTNVGMVWSGGVLKFVPYTDVPISGNGATFTPNTAPIYDLTDDDFLSGDEEGPVKVTRGSVGDSFNSVTLEYMNRANSYNLAVMTAQDQADIQENGLRQMSSITAHWITESNVANIVANLILQRSLFIRNTYEFTLGWTKIGLEPMDLVTLTDVGMGLNKTPVRIVSMEEDESGNLAITAEDFPKGSASATLYPNASGSGFAPNFNEAPGTALNPVIFEAPTQLTTQGGGLELWLACGSLSPTYGGCEVWVSLSGSSYQRAGTLNGSSRYGVTTSVLAGHANNDISTETFGVQLAAGGQLLSGSYADMAALSTLCYVGGEFLGYENATLTGDGAYTLGNHLLRDAYAALPSVSHAAGSPFVRCDAALARMPLSPDYIGKTIYVKVLPFNRYGGGLADLAAATVYTYAVTGIQANSPPPAPPGLALEGPFTINTAKFRWDTTANAAKYNVQIFAGPGPIYTMVREVPVGDALRYDYSASDAKSDGGPWRSLRIKVQGINPNGAVGAFAQLDVLNNQIGALVAPALTAGVQSAQFSCAPPADYDFKGLRVWASTTSGFAPGPTNLIYDGPSTTVPINALADGSALAAGVTLYVRAAGYDNFDASGLTVSSQLACTPVATAGELQFGGENLAYNSGFEKSTNGLANGFDIWNDAGSSEPTTASVFTPGRSGVGVCQQIAWSGNHTSTKGIRGTVCKPGWKPNSKYTISFYAKTTSLQAPVKMLLSFGGGDRTVIERLNPNISSAWQRYAFTINWGATTESIGYAYISLGYGSGAGNFQIDDLMVVEGDALLGYTPSISEVSGVADAAYTGYLTISADGYLSRDEKPELIQKWNAIYNEVGQLYNAAANIGLGVEPNNYYAQFAALQGYLSNTIPSWNDSNVDTLIDRAVFNQYFVNYFSARAVLIAATTARTSQLSTWSGVTGAGKPQDSATVGAPSGTYVSGVLSDTLVDQASAGSSAATILNTPFTINGLAEASADVYKPRAVVANYIVTCAGGVGPFRFTFKLVVESQATPNASIVVSTTGSGNTNDRVILYGLAQVSDASTTSGWVECTAVDSKGRASFDRFHFDISC